MKARYDYVSNSSSCSFVIKDVAKFLDSLKADLGEISLPWFMEDKISFTVTCLEKDAEELESKLAGNEYKFKEYSDWDYEKKYRATLEDEHYVQAQWLQHEQSARICVWDHKRRYTGPPPLR